MMLLSLLSLSLPLIAHAKLTASQIDELRRDMMDAFDSVSNSDDPASNKPLIASTVRLVFHDCAGPMNTNHGSGSNARIDNDRRLCDGCIDLDILDHVGLEDLAVGPLEEVYVSKGWIDKINGADYWIAAGNIAIEYAHSMSPKSGDLPELDYLFGRELCSDDAPDAETTKGTRGTEFPMALFGWDTIAEFFEEKLDMDTRDIVAMLGCHTLGRSHRSATGFEGKWTQKTFEFDNAYFENLIDTDQRWTQTTSGRGAVQWTNEDRDLVMLTSDIAILANMEEEDSSGRAYLNEETGVCRCRLRNFGDSDFDTCPDEVSVPDGVEFARSNSAFLRAFASAWNKLISHNQRNLERVKANPFRDSRSGSSRAASAPSGESVVVESGEESAESQESVSMSSVSVDSGSSESSDSDSSDRSRSSSRSSSSDSSSDSSSSSSSSSSDSSDSSSSSSSRSYDSSDSSSSSKSSSSNARWNKGRRASWRRDRD